MNDFLGDEINLYESQILNDIVYRIYENLSVENWIKRI